MECFRPRSASSLTPPPTWIYAFLRRADQNHDDKMSYAEVQTLLQMINIELSEQYALSLFQVRRGTQANGKHTHTGLYTKPIQLV